MTSTAVEGAAVRPASMRIHPIFTRTKDWTGDGRVDGVEALVEFQDQFGDPTKASGRLVFELYEYKPYEPDRRGDRITNPWIGTLESVGDQRDRWNRTSRTYSFPLQSDAVRASASYVLMVTFEDATGHRFFDQIVLEGNRDQPETAPALTGVQEPSLDAAPTESQQPAAPAPDQP